MIDQRSGLPPETARSANAEVSAPEDDKFYELKKLRRSRVSLDRLEALNPAIGVLSRHEVPAVNQCWGWSKTPNSPILGT